MGANQSPLKMMLQFKKGISLYRFYLFLPHYRTAPLSSLQLMLSDAHVILLG